MNVTTLLIFTIGIFKVANYTINVFYWFNI